MSDEKLVCPVEGCGGEYSTLAGLRLHITGEHGFYCRMCGKILPSRSQRFNHEFTAHFKDIREYRAWVKRCGWLVRGGVSERIEENRSQ